jgi:hypothetical protein
VAADVAVRVEAFALSEIADRSDLDGPLARSSAALIHRGDVPVLFSSNEIVLQRQGCQGRGSFAATSATAPRQHLLVLGRLGPPGGGPGQHV